MPHHGFCFRFFLVFIFIMLMLDFWYKALFPLSNFLLILFACRYFCKIDSKKVMCTLSFFSLCLFVCTRHITGNLSHGSCSVAVIIDTGKLCEGLVALNKLVFSQNKKINGGPKKENPLKMTYSVRYINCRKNTHIFFIIEKKGCYFSTTVTE